MRTKMVHLGRFVLHMCTKWARLYLTRRGRGAGAGLPGPLPAAQPPPAGGQHAAHQPRHAGGHPVAAAHLLQPLHLCADSLGGQHQPQPTDVPGLPRRVYAVTQEQDGTLCWLMNCYIFKIIFNCFFLYKNNCCHDWFLWRKLCIHQIQL